MKPVHRAAARQRIRHPVLSVLTALVWLLLQQSVDVGNLLMAAVLGWTLPRVLTGFLGQGSRPRNFALAARLAVIVVWDIIVSNITVAKLVLNPRSAPQPAWVKVPLTLTQPTAQTLLAAIITMTPGTVSAIVDEDAACIWVHALDCDDPVGAAADMDRRYQQPLMEILG